MDYFTLLEAGNDASSFYADMRRFIPRTIYDITQQYLSHLVSKTDKNIHQVYDDIADQMYRDDEDYKSLVDFFLARLSGDISDHLGRGLKVFIKDKQRSSDDMASRSNGYWSEAKGELVVFVDGIIARGAILDAMAQSVNGALSYHLFDAIAPTLIHEYTHYMQTSKGKSFGYTKDRGVTKSPELLRRTPEKSKEHEVAYIGALHELDAFASGAAAELISQYESKYGGYITPDVIRDFIEDAKMGYLENSKQGKHISDFIMRAIDGEFDEVGLTPKEVNEVRKRFYRYLVSKLERYSPELSLDRYPSTWIKSLNIKQQGKSTQWLIDRITDYVANEEDVNAENESYKILDFLIDAKLIGDNTHRDFQNQSKIRDIISRILSSKHKKYLDWLPVID